MPSTDSVKEFQQAGRERLYPGITNPNWLVLRKRRELFRRWLEGIVPERAAVLDVGGRLRAVSARCCGKARRYLGD